ncbi:transposase [Rhodococcus sp. KBS0724]|uniref:transposase n=1 Tax=Rhodococcus sp. KBS0724 TaxID=1179674 RepID=UPI0037CC19CB
MPGVGVRTGIKILLEVGDIDRFPTPGHLAVYAGLAPRTHRSGTSIRGEHQQRAGNKRLKKARFRAAFASLPDPSSRAYYDRKRTEGKRHNAAILCLARRRCDVLYAMLTTGTTYLHPVRSAA